MEIPTHSGLSSVRTERVPHKEHPLAFLSCFLLLSRGTTARTNLLVPSSTHKNLLVPGILYKYTLVVSLLYHHRFSVIANVLENALNEKRFSMRLVLAYCIELGTTMVANNDTTIHRIVMHSLVLGIVMHGLVYRIVMHGRPSVRVARLGRLGA